MEIWYPATVTCKCQMTQFVNVAAEVKLKEHILTRHVGVCLVSILLHKTNIAIATKIINIKIG